MQELRAGMKKSAAQWLQESLLKTKILTFLMQRDKNDIIYIFHFFLDKYLLDCYTNQVLVETT